MRRESVKTHTLVGTQPVSVCLASPKPSSRSLDFGAIAPRLTVLYTQDQTTRLLTGT
jgi:hypothetical protein